jgi:hypothetical protein
MRFPTAVIVLAANLAIVGGCARPDPAEAAPDRPKHGWKQPWQSDRPLPPWIADPTSGGSRLSAYGSAEYRSSESRSEQRDRAMQAARDELARMIRVRVRTAVRDFLADSGSASATYSDTISQQVADTSIDGSHQIDEWQNEKTLELFVLAGVGLKQSGDLAAAVVKAAGQADSAAMPFAAKLQADAAFAELDRLLSQPGR